MMIGKIVNQLWLFKFRIFLKCVFLKIRNGGQSFMVKKVCIEHTVLDLYVKFQINQTYGVRGKAFPKLHFWAVIKANYSWLECFF